MNVNYALFIAVEYLMMEFNSSKSRVPKMKQGLDCSNRDNVRLLKCVSIPFTTLFRAKLLLYETLNFGMKFYIC